ncbi:hypothetical protein [Magnetovibrio sp.]|uniref:hypothetical protein n=1 Tax=Magnetovibrio sp. TaxID=2024836 RepID=UPI002F93989D
MLSRNLEALFEHLKPYAKTGINADPSHVFMICAIIQSAIDDAKNLEARPIPLIDQQHEGGLPDNVVRFDAPRDGADIAHFIPRPRTPGPEDAA